MDDQVVRESFLDRVAPDLGMNIAAEVMVMSARSALDTIPCILDQYCPKVLQ